MKKIIIQRLSTSYSHSNTSSEIVRTSIIWLMPAMVFVYMLALVSTGINSLNWKPMIISLGISVGFASFIQILWLQSRSLGTALLLLFLPLFLIGTYLQILAPIFAGILIFSFLVVLVKIKKLNPREVCYFLVATLTSAGILGLTLLQRASMGYAQPFISSTIHKDTLFHVAISSMLKNYGATSTGLNGLVAIHYHAASHSVFSSLSLISNLSVFDIYSYIYPLTFIPLMLTVFLCLAEEILPSRAASGWIARAIILSILLLGLDNKIFSEAAFWMSFYVSESYTLALILLMGLLSLLIEREKLSNDLKTNFNSIILLLLFALTCFTKISVGFIFLGIVGSWLVFGQSKNLLSRLKLTIGLSLVFLVIYRLASGSSISFDLFHFIKFYVVSNSFSRKLFLYCIFHLFFTNLLIVLYFRGAKRHLSLWMICGIVLSTLMGTIPGVLLAIPGGSAYYFSNVSQMIALPFLLILITTFLRKAVIVVPGNNLLSVKNTFLRFRNLLVISRKTVGSVTVVSFILLIYFIFAFLPSSKKIFYSLGGLSRNMKNSIIPYSPYFITELRKISRDPSTKNMMIYLPRNLEAFWKLDSCDKIGFILPAIAERSSLRSLPDSSCGAENYGYEGYAAEFFERSQRLDTDDVLKQEAYDLGFSGVIILDEKKIRIIK